MDRRRELLEIIGDKNESKAGKLVDEIIFIEGQLTELKKYPFISINPKNPNLQKATPAAKQYKELLQQYNNSLKLLLKISGDLADEKDEDSPLRAWIRKRNEENNMDSG